MTDKKWLEIVSHVLERLKMQPSFSVDKEEFFKHFGLSDDDSIEFIQRRDFPNEKHFGFHRKEVDSRPLLIFSVN